MQIISRTPFSLTCTVTVLRTCLAFCFFYFRLFFFLSAKHLTLASFLHTPQPQQRQRQTTRNSNQYQEHIKQPNMPSVSTIAQAEEVRKTSPEQAIPLYQSILAAAGAGMSLPQLALRIHSYHGLNATALFSWLLQDTKLTSFTSLCTFSWDTM